VNRSNDAAEDSQPSWGITAAGAGR
jgi:hypothetical protein